MTETQTKPRLQGQFEWSDAKSIHIQARFDKVAVHQNRLMFISLVAFSQDVKAIRAGLAAGLDSPHAAHERHSHQGRRDHRSQTTSGPRATATGSTPTGSASARSTPSSPAASRASCLNDGDDALWQELKQERFTTPLLRGWLPHVRKELEIKSLLPAATPSTAHACVLTATSADLDSIVESGLKNGLITHRTGRSTTDGHPRPDPDHRRLLRARSSPST